MSATELHPQTAHIEELPRKDSHAANGSTHASSDVKAAAAIPKGNPKDSMKSTWRRDKSNWTPWHHIMNNMNIQPTFLNVPIPKHDKSDPMPHLPDSQMQKWILFHTGLTLAVHQLYVFLTGKNLGPVAAIIYYSICFKLIAIHELRTITYLGHIYGFLDGDKHERDQVPDWSVGKVVRSLISTSTIRPIFSIMLAYRTSQAPSSINLYWLPVEIGLYGVVLDFWFYWYHRLMHDMDSLWKYHRTHHLTKHPNPLLTLYADTEQEIFDIAVIPIMTWLTLKAIGLPMGFYSWWICHMYVVFTELIGHSGLRMNGCPPSTISWLLQLTGTQLVIEDHDLHHRQGWKKSGNYGKQTKLWDAIFGTTMKRIETLPEKIDYNNRVELPLFRYPKLPQSALANGKPTRMTK